MSLEIKNYANIGESARHFDSDAEVRYRSDNWYFKYITQNTEGQDQTEAGGEIDTNKDDYPIGTIFFDSSPQSVYLSTTLKNVVIDSTPPEIIKNNIQYMVLDSDYKCELTIESDCPIDIGQLVISNGDIILYESLRKVPNKDNTGRITSEYIKNISVAKNGKQYVLNFAIDKSYDVNLLNKNQITVTVWDIAANTTTFKTDRKWYFFKRGVDNQFLSPLTIEFIEINPPDKIIQDNTEGSVLVKITNPNIDFREIEPTVVLNEHSIGYLDSATFTYSLERGVLLFYVTHVHNTGNIIIDSWITIDNKEIYSVIKQETFVEGTCGEFIYADEGRRYKFASYIPKFLQDETYDNFVMFTQDLLNTCYVNPDTGNRIGVLEKIARIGNFNYIDKIDTPLIDYIRDEYNFEITPNFNEYVYYMNYKPIKKNEN